MDESDKGPQPRSIRVPGYLVDQEIGLGSAIKRATARAGIRACGGCQRRAARLDQRVVLHGRIRSASPNPTTGGHHGP
jgi:hypothetical protein